MLGRVRASSVTSLELLEMERQPPKIIKNDSLSIYESTLLKLKQGSHCNRSMHPEDSARKDAHCTMETDSPELSPAANDAACSSVDSFPNSSCSTISTGSSRDEGCGRNMSIVFMFSKYKSSQHQHSSNDKDVIPTGTSYSSSSISSPESSC